MPAAVHEQLMGHFRLFCALGGMPEVVQIYEGTKDFRAADRVQRTLLQGYLYDIAHYASASEKIKAEKCFLTIASQLLGKENKFQYKVVEKGGNATCTRASLPTPSLSPAMRFASTETSPPSARWTSSSSRREA